MTDIKNEDTGYRLLNKLISFFTHQSFFIFAIAAELY